MSATPYAGLLERLRSLIPSGLYTGNSDFWYVNPDGPEAAEAISALLKALEQTRSKLLGKPTMADVISALNIIDAALNSDASQGGKE
jgi:hypothetical protein